MRKRILTVAVGVVFGLGGYAVAQVQPYTIVHADGSYGEAQFSASDPGSPLITGRRWTLTGNVVLEVNGVLVKADRAVVNQQTGEISLEGNVRLTPPPTQR
jgi:hypothetical protein